MSESEAANIFKCFTVFQRYFVNVLGSTTTSQVYALIQDSQPIQFTQLGSHPVLTPYLIPSSTPIDFNKFTADLEDIFQNLTLSYRFGIVTGVERAQDEDGFKRGLRWLGWSERKRGGQHKL